MKRKNSTNDESFVSIPSPISSDGKVDIKDIKLPSLVISNNFTIDEIIKEVARRRPKKTFLSLLEWTRAMELAAIIRTHTREKIFPYSKEREIISVIIRLIPDNPNDLGIFRQITKNDWLPQNIKDATREQLKKLVDKD